MRIMDRKVPGMLSKTFFAAGEKGTEEGREQVGKERLLGAKWPILK